MTLVLLTWLVSGICAGCIADSRGGSGRLWFLVGILFGPFGLALSFLLGSHTFCITCRKRVHPQATKCPYCQSAIVSAKAAYDLVIKAAQEIPSMLAKPKVIEITEYSKDGKSDRNMWLVKFRAHIKKPDGGHHDVMTAKVNLTTNAVTWAE